MKHIRYRPLVFAILLLSVSSGRLGPGSPAVVAAAEPPPEATFQITFAGLGYSQRTLHSPYGITEYNLRLPEGWQLLDNSFLELDFSYTFQILEAPNTQAFPTRFGHLEVMIDGQSPTVIPLQDATLEHRRLQIPLPVALFNNPTRRTHTIRLTLNADLICRLQHEAELVIHPTSRFLFTYQQLPLTADLALYPRPFYQRAFAPDQLRFVLPEQPTPAEIQAAVTMAAKLGDLAAQLTLSGTTDVAWTERLADGAPFPEHAILIGTPERNQAIRALQQYQALPLSLHERQLALNLTGPVAAAPGQRMTYTLALTNTTPLTWTALQLYAALPAYSEWLTCTPACTFQPTGAEIGWEIPLLLPGSVQRYDWIVQASQLITAVIVDTTATLLPAEGLALNASTLTTTLQLLPPEPFTWHSTVAAPPGFFFMQANRAVPETDGLLQEITAPWDSTRALLVVTGLSDAAVARASLALSSESQFPGLSGALALIQEAHPAPAAPPPAPSSDLTLADLGYDDTLLEGFSQETEYYFDLPIGWQFNEGSFLDLSFSHSQMLNYNNSELSVLINGKPLTTVPLNQETATQGALRLALRPSQLAPGKVNRLTLRAQLYPLNQCGYASLWLQISNRSRLHLERTEQQEALLNLKYYPHPLDQQPDLGNLLVVLPPTPQVNEWESALQLAAALGKAAGGSTIQPTVLLGWNATTPLTATPWADYHLLVLGRPSRNPLLQQVNADLPQPFQPGTDAIEQRLDQVIFRLPPNLDLGLVQLLPSPLNPKRALLAVTGTTEQGLADAVAALLTRPWDLVGNLTLLRATTLRNVDTRPLTSSGKAGAVLTAVPEMTAVATVTPTPTPQPTTPTLIPTGTPLPAVPPTTTPRWLFPFLGLVGLALVGILGFVFWQSRRAARPSSRRR